MTGVVRRKSGSATHQTPRPACRPRGFASLPPRGDARSRVARVLAACRCRVSMSRCRCSADLAPPGSARGDFGRRGHQSLARRLTAARPPGAPARDGDASRNPPPHPAARCLATAPLVGCSAGRIGMARECGDKGAGLCPERAGGRASAKVCRHRTTTTFRSTGQHSHPTEALLILLVFPRSA